MLESRVSARYSSIGIRKYRFLFLTFLKKKTFTEKIFLDFKLCCEMDGVFEEIGSNKNVSKNIYFSKYFFKGNTFFIKW